MQEKMPINLLISISLTSNEMYKNIVPSQHKDHTLYLKNLGIQICNKFVNMGLRTKISFYEFLVKLKINENIYLLALQCKLC
jgi:hypothetical protein